MSHVSFYFSATFCCFVLILEVFVKMCSTIPVVSLKQNFLQSSNISEIIFWYFTWMLYLVKMVSPFLKNVFIYLFHLFVYFKQEGFGGSGHPLLSRGYVSWLAG